MADISSIKGDLRLNNITKTYGDFTAVNDLSLTIPEGSFFALLGPSGCGKTTTLRMVAGLEEPTKGSISLGSTDITYTKPYQRPINTVFQNYALFPHLSIFENIAFGLRRRGIKDVKEQVDKALELVELSHLAGRKPTQLSGGQQQRVALARAIVREPNAFLMDEPLSNLDAKLRVSTRAQIKNLHHSLKTTTIYVTHDQIEAMTLADRVVVMNHGVVQQVGTPTEIYDRPANTFVASFIGNPAMNLIAGEVAGGTFRAEGMQVPGLDAADGPVTLGFRAEDASVVTEGGNITAPVYSMELLGDATLVSVRIDAALVAVRAPKDFRIEIGAPLQIRVPLTAVHLFGKADGARIDA